MTQQSRWRVRSREVILRVMADNPSSDEKELRRRISAAYPFGERAMHPYKIWLSEVKRQLERRNLPAQNSLQMEDV